MCSIFGFFKPSGAIGDSFEENGFKIPWKSLFHKITENSSERGKDAFGYVKFGRGAPIVNKWSLKNYSTHQKENAYYGWGVDEDSWGLLANNRAEPETEFQKDFQEKDFQPFTSPTLSGNTVHVVHNGLVSNDAEIRERLKLNLDTETDSAVLPYVFRQATYFQGFLRDIKYKLKGSYALAVYNTLSPDKLFLYRDFNPLTVLYNKQENVYIFASFEKYVREAISKCKGNQLNWATIDIPPYSGAVISKKGIEIASIDSVDDSQKKEPVQELFFGKKALIVMSGGLDSVVAAIMMKNMGFKLDFLHFSYEGRAQEKEISAVKDLAEHFNANLEIFKFDLFKNLGGSSLVDRNIDLADGKEGAEHAKDWIPARNTVFTAIAAAYADRFKYDAIVLGLNLSEGMTFPDNTTEYFETFSRVLSLGTMQRPKIICPLSNMTKHELVLYGMREDPDAIKLSYSCYTGNDKHCGTCASCYLRKIAFKMNNLNDPADFED